MGGGSRSEGRGFESWHHILDGHLDIFTLICCKICNNVCLKRPKMNKKEPGVGPFKKNISYTSVALKKSLHACNVFEDGGDGGLAFYPNDTSLNSIEA